MNKEIIILIVQNIISSSWFQLFRCWIAFWKFQREHQTFDNISLGSAKLWRFYRQKLFYKTCYILFWESSSYFKFHAWFWRIIRWCQVFTQEFNHQRRRVGTNQRWFGNRHMMILSIRIWLVNFRSFFSFGISFLFKFHREPRHG